MYKENKLILSFPQKESFVLNLGKGGCSLCLENYFMSSNRIMEC